MSPASARECADAVERHWAALVATLRAHADTMASLFAGGPLTSADVLRVAQPLALEVLADETLVGAGFVAAPGSVLDETHFLAWWQGEHKEQLTHPVVTVQVTDYTRQEWFRVPQATGRPHLTGPYVDYVCTDEYVMTTTLPVHHEGRMVGLFGADTLAETLETIFDPVFAGSDCVLVNDHGRVVLSDDPAVLPGRMVVPEEFGGTVVCGDLPLRVLSGRRPAPSASGR